MGYKFRKIYTPKFKHRTNAKNHITNCMPIYFFF